MNKDKLRRIRRRLVDLRKRLANIRYRELASLATSLGRRKDDRGKEPTFVSTLIQYSRPITIPNHPGALHKYTAGNILDQLEEDVFKLEDELKE